MMYSLFEATLSQLKRKQQSIVRLFPDFFTNPIKVKGVIDKGGVRMSSMEGDTWQFSIHSGSEEGKWYDAHVRWKNIVPTIQNLVADRRNWNKAKTSIDLRKLSAKMFEKADVELDCTCLTGDTLIPLLDGRVRTIEELLEEYGITETFWIYSSDEKGDFVPAQATCVGQTGQTSTLVEVELDNGRIVRCTPNHLFRMRDGSYKHACDLREGDSLLPLYRQEQESSGKYSQTYQKVMLNSRSDKIGRPIWKTVHRVVAELLLKTEKLLCERGRTFQDPYVVVHHRDMNTHNNCPDNLQWMGTKEHWKYHSNVDHSNAITAHRKAWEDPEFRKRRTEQNRKAGKLCLEKHPEIIEKGNAAGIAFMQSGDGRELTRQRNVDLWSDSQHRKERCENIKKSITDDQRRARSERMKRWWAEHPERREEQAKKGRNLFHSLPRDPKTGRVTNHRVVSVRKSSLCDGPIPVYDLSVPGFQNFALEAGVFVHNCPADTYYGKEYIRNQDKYRAQYGEPENRPPDKRNPKQYGAMCKHLQVLMRVLPFYKSTMANWLKKEYGDVIKEAEKEARTKAGTFQTAAQQLKRRRTKESLEEALSPSEKLQDLAEEEDLLRDDMPLVFFLLPSGKYVNVPVAHEVTASDAGTSIHQLLSDGTIRGFDDEDYLNLEIFHANQPTSQQWTTLKRAIRSSMGLLVDFTDGEFPEDTLRDDSGGSKAYRRLQNYYKGGDQSKSKTAQFHESIKEAVLPPIQQKLLKGSDEYELDEIEAHTLILSDGTLLGGEVVYHEELVDPIRVNDTETHDLVDDLIRSGVIYVSTDTYADSLVLSGNGRITAQQWRYIALELRNTLYKRIEVSIVFETWEDTFQIPASDLSTRQMLSVVHLLLQGKTQRFSDYRI